ncbi:hypothetical protein B0H13DRAFT_2275503 [Mycena leptocephala]|nr:hypothetical protein B0H13DRAFT_2275503 [Mycena leptocephala]
MIGSSLGYRHMDMRLSCPYWCLLFLFLLSLPQPQQNPRINSSPLEPPFPSIRPRQRRCPSPRGRGRARRGTAASNRGVGRMGCFRSREGEGKEARRGESAGFPAGDVLAPASHSGVDEGRPRDKDAQARGWPRRQRTRALTTGSTHSTGSGVRSVVSACTADRAAVSVESAGRRNRETHELGTRSNCVRQGIEQRARGGLVKALNSRCETPRSELGTRSGILNTSASSALGLGGTRKAAPHATFEAGVWTGAGSGERLR